MMISAFPRRHQRSCWTCERKRQNYERTNRGSVRICAFFWQSKAPEGPPKPSTRFTKGDLKRIKQEGPTLDDVTEHVTVEYDTREGAHVKRELDFVPPNVLGNVYSVPDVEPAWYNLPEMSLMEFHHGLQQRNWTSPHFTESAEPWAIQIWQDSGRFMRPSFPGYRATVTKPDGSKFFVNMPIAGAPTFLEDRIAGGTMGAIYKQSRTPNIEAVQINEYGYNQVFEQLFQAFEERIPAKAMAKMVTHAKVPRSKFRYDCPADNYLNVDYKWTPAEFSLRGPLEALPDLLVTVASLSFVIVCVVYSLFRSNKKAPSDLQEALEFAQSKAKARKDGTTGVTLDDVAGLDVIKGEFLELVTFLKDPAYFASTGVKPPKGVLLEGPPGTGKTLIARAIAGEANVGFYQMSGSEFVEAIVGVGAARVRDLFKRARAYNSPCIIFVDEIDALGIKRAEAGVRTNEEREQTLNQLLTEMDGFNPSSGVVFIAATNRADLLDPALMRAGRFDRKIPLPRPDARARLAILQVHAKKHAFADDVDLNQLALDLPGLVGADLANVLNESALAAVREGSNEIHERHLLQAKDRILQGVRKPMLSDTSALGQKILFALAVHEGGRALYATDIRMRSPNAIEAIEKVTTIRRGADLTKTVFQRGHDDEYLIVTKTQMQTQLHVALAGHAAEAVLGLDISTYSCKDFTVAREIAERMVMNFGMSKLGVTTYARPFHVESSYREGKEDILELFQQQQLLRSSTPGIFQPNSDMKSKLETVQDEMIREAYDEVKARLSDLKPALQQVADELYARKELEGYQVVKLYRGQPLDSTSSDLQ